MKQCKKCHASMADDSLFCTRCGAALGADGSTANATPGFVGSDFASSPSVGFGSFSDARGKESGDSAQNSLFLKYAGFLDNEALYKVAWAKEHGLLRGENGEAEEIYKLLALRGHSEAMFRFAMMQMAKDPPETETARKWLNAAKDLGHIGADTYLKTSMPAEPSPRTERTANNGTVSVPAVPCAEGCLSGEQIFDKLGSAIVEISAEDGNVCAASSGFIVSSSGFVLTNAHAILMENGEVFPKILLKHSRGVSPAFPMMYGSPADGVNDSIDIALLFCEDLIYESADVAELGNSDTVRNGQKVYLIGNSLGIGTCITSGIVSDAARMMPGLSYPYIMTDAAANHGNSGGPFINEQGKVIGVLVAGIDNAQGMNFVIPINTVKQFLSYLFCQLDLGREVLAELAPLTDFKKAPAPKGKSNYSLHITRDAANYKQIYKKTKNK